MTALFKYLKNTPYILLIYLALSFPWHLEKPTKCYECIPGDSTESAELPDCMINSTEPGNLITCNENSVGCEITTIGRQ